MFRSLNDFTCEFVFKNLWIPSLSFPVPLPCTILTVWSLAKAASSKNLSMTNVASSTFCPITFISDFTVLVLDIFV